MKKIGANWIDVRPFMGNTARLSVRNLEHIKHLNCKSRPITIRRTVDGHEPNVDSGQSEYKIFRPIFDQERNAQKSQSQQPRVASSITAEERRIFRDITRKFGGPVADVTARHRSFDTTSSHVSIKLSKAVDNELPAHELDLEQILGLFAPAPSDTKTGQDIASDDLQDSKGPNEASSTITSDDTVTSTSDPSPTHQQIRTSAFNALRQVSHSISACLRSSDPPPDVALWSYIETEIFPIVKLLRHPLLKPTNRLSVYNRPDRLTIDDLVSAENPPAIPSSLADVPAETPLIPLLTILYPAATLLAMRSFAAYHPASGFPYALLPAIKAQGPTSYLLAGNTHFFNVLLQLQWEVYSDVTAISGLLNEMTWDAVGYNDRTLAIILAILTDRNGEDGRGNQWWENNSSIKEMVELEKIWVPKLSSTAVDENRLARR